MFVNIIRKVWKRNHPVIVHLESSHCCVAWRCPEVVAWFDSGKNVVGISLKNTLGLMFWLAVLFIAWENGSSLEQMYVGA